MEFQTSFERSNASITTMIGRIFSDLDYKVVSVAVWACSNPHSESVQGCGIVRLVTPQGERAQCRFDHDTLLSLIRQSLRLQGYSKFSLELVDVNGHLACNVTLSIDGTRTIENVRTVELLVEVDLETDALRNMIRKAFDATPLLVREVDLFAVDSKHGLDFTASVKTETPQCESSQTEIEHFVLVSIVRRNMETRGYREFSVQLRGDAQDASGVYRQVACTIISRICTVGIEPGSL